MELLQKVEPIEVKRCFVISDFMRQIGSLKKAEKIILGLPESMLDLIIKGGYKKRFEIYSRMEWYVGTVDINEVGVWKKAGGLPRAWTKGSLAETASLVSKGLENKSKQLTARSRIAIPGIMKNSLSEVQKEKYLLPIILPGGTLGRKNLTEMKGDIDDGNMRSIALAVSGKKTIKAYIGKEIKLKRTHGKQTKKSKSKNT